MKILPEALKQYVGDSMPDTATIDKLFTEHAFEIEEIVRVGEHEVIDVKVLPDRSSDCLCHRGLAHELAALMKKPLEKDPFREEAPLEPKTEKLSVVIENGEHCRRFSGALITGVSIGPTPDWLKKTLEALGQRSINNVVDATNYVMLMLGQPLHAYDADKFPHDEGGWHFGVRMAREGEEVTTLSNDTYTLTPKVQLITDAMGDIPVGIAGVKGGKYAEIHSGTTNIILEAANFDSVITRRASQSLKLQTDASKRFENDLPAELTAYGLRECVRIILEIAGGTLLGYVDEYLVRKANPTVHVAETKVNMLLGVTIPKEEVESILTHLSFTYEASGDGWDVVAPWERTDVTIPEDVIADIGRVYGYDHVASVVPETVPLREINARHYYSEQMRGLLLEEGFSEVITSSFRKKDVIELQNALASDKGCLRSALKENVREVLDRNMPNADLLGLPMIQVFEIGTVFSKTEGGKGIVEHTALAIGVRQKQTGPTPKDDERLKEIISKLETALGTSLKGTIKEGVFECNLSEVVNALPIPSAYAPVPPPSEITFQPFSTYPFVSRDIALWVPEGVDAATLMESIRAIAGELLFRTTLFDEFHKDGKISYAFRLIFQSFEKTLTDTEVGDIMTKITTALQNKGYTVR
jgi:phenylalanyl-tRNA synthetase beta chain